MRYRYSAAEHGFRKRRRGEDEARQERERASELSQAYSRRVLQRTRPSKAQGSATAAPVSSMNIESGWIERAFVQWRAIMMATAKCGKEAHGSCKLGLLRKE